MENAIELNGLMQDDELDAVVGGCKKYEYSYSSEQSESNGGSRGRNIVVASEVNSIVVDDINISADDGSQVFVTFVQDN